MTRALVLLILLTSVAHGGPSKTAELDGFWDAVYKDPPFEEHPKCQFDSDAPANCRDRGEEGHIPNECLKYLSWETMETLICPNLCANPSQIKVEHGVVKFDVEYLGPSPTGWSGDPDHYADRTKETRHVEIPLNAGKVSTNAYANTKRYVETDFTIPITPALKGSHREGQRVQTLYFDRLRVKASLGQYAGRCDENANYTADTGRGGMLELELLAHAHESGEDINLGCQVFLHAPDYKEGKSCGRETMDSSGPAESGGGGSHGGNGQCKSQCKDSAYQCRKGCRSDASCTRQCGDNEGSCLRGC